MMGRNGKDVTGEKNPNYKNGYCTKHKKTGLYNSWQNMKSRCLNPNNPKYNRYGGRGINICDDWLTIEGFVEWSINNGWKKGLTLDRIDNDKGYTPSNCQWITACANSRKKSTTKLCIEDAMQIRIKYNNGNSMPSLAKEYGVVHGTIWFIVNNFTHVPEGECAKRLKRHKTIT
jgi:hypothetical protein